jgi:hypothetical protein
MKMSLTVFLKIGKRRFRFVLNLKLSAGALALLLWLFG